MQIEITLKPLSLRNGLRRMPYGNLISGSFALRMLFGRNVPKAARAARAAQAMRWNIRKSMAVRSRE
ncbi:MAG: hypothetical protein IT493_14330 [Gammaproteobacteria bacterium]|nr:hypothetical protein [Gammaproteobacteria bacterium]